MALFLLVNLKSNFYHFVIRKKAAAAPPTANIGSPTSKCEVPKPNPFWRNIKQPTPAAPAANGIAAVAAEATA